MSKTPSRPLKPSPDVLIQEVNGESVLLDLKGEQYFSLNKQGTHIWQLLVRGMGDAEILDELESCYEVSREQLEAEVQQWMQQLEEAGLLLP